MRFAQFGLPDLEISNSTQSLVLAGSVTVIIPALHRPELSERALRSIDRQQYPKNLLSVVLVENAAPAGRVLQLETLTPQLGFPIRQILLDENSATTRSVNVALAQSNSEFVLLLNNDMELAPAFIGELVQTLQEDSSAGFATGKLLSGKEPGLIDGAGDEMLAGGGAYRIGHDDRDCEKYNLARRVLSGCGGATLYRRSLLGPAPLDENFFAYLEDVDLSLRLLLQGTHGRYVPGAVATHIGSATLGDPEHPFIFEAVTRNQILLLASNFSARALLNAAPRIFIFQSLWMARAVVSGRLSAYLRAIFRAARLLPSTLRKRRQRLRSRKISNAEFRAALLQSEAEIYRWQAALPMQSRSRLLSAYFFFFKPRPSVRQEP